MEMKPTLDDLIARHGSQKQAEPSDPLALVGMRVPGGDVDALLRCFIEEYAAMGYGAEEILALFREPRYAAIHPAYLRLGEDAVRARIAAVLQKCGVFMVAVRHAEPAAKPPKLVQIKRLPGLQKDEQP
jgi:hypothetical protein